MSPVLCLLPFLLFHFQLSIVHCQLYFTPPSSRAQPRDLSKKHRKAIQNRLAPTPAVGVVKSIKKTSQSDNRKLVPAKAGIVNTTPLLHKHIQHLNVHVRLCSSVPVLSRLVFTLCPALHFSQTLTSPCLKTLQNRVISL